MRAATAGGRIRWQHGKTARTLRDRICDPLPHDFEHTLQLPHSDTVQSTAQVLRLHATVFVVAGQTRPPAAAGAVITRWHCIVPPPHLAEHCATAHAVHGPTLQSTAQGAVAHAECWSRAGQRRPPKAVCDLTQRWRMRVPPPHVREQAVHVDQAEVAQSTGHCPCHAQ